MGAAFLSAIAGIANEHTHNHQCRFKRNGHRNDVGWLLV